MPQDREAARDPVNFYIRPLVRDSLLNYFRQAVWEEASWLVDKPTLGVWRKRIDVNAEDSGDPVAHSTSDLSWQRHREQLCRGDAWKGKAEVNQFSPICLLWLRASAAHTGAAFWGVVPKMCSSQLLSVSLGHASVNFCSFYRIDSGKYSQQPMHVPYSSRY